ncbi:hypothetical protein, partial [Acinetobacter baumannii]|uniref:hypothetical protein n=1 Tax=Acinetobacter baumannii TaxID=470 RepID=UPI001CBDA60E
MSLPSRNAEIFVFGFSLPITNLIGFVLAKNCSAVETTFSPTVLVLTPLPISLFCGLIFEELPTDAALTPAFAWVVLSSPSELIVVKDGEDPTQLTMKESCKLEK